MTKKGARGETRKREIVEKKKRPGNFYGEPKSSSVEIIHERRSASNKKEPMRNR